MSVLCSGYLQPKQLETLTLSDIKACSWMDALVDKEHAVRAGRAKFRSVKLTREAGNREPCL